MSELIKDKPKCIIILSTKSSGSSALQSLLAMQNQVSNVESTRHARNETLYWTKAASILNLPQRSMLDSEVPIPQARAKKELVEFLEENIDDFRPPADDRQLILEGWKQMVYRYQPIFLEKSPHHLLQWSALELIAEAIKKFPEIDFLVIGLIRNPMDVMYSTWSRWRTFPEKKQKEWFVEYNNLLKSKELFGKHLVHVKYEDVISNVANLKDVLAFANIDADAIDKKYMHKKSLAKWKTDKSYGFNLSEEVLELANQFGYTKDQLVNDRASGSWPISKTIKRASHIMFNPTILRIRKIARKVLNKKN